MVYVMTIGRTTAGINKADDAWLTAVGCLDLGENYEYCGRSGRILQLPAAWARGLPRLLTHDDDESQQLAMDFG